MHVETLQSILFVLVHNFYLIIIYYYYYKMTNSVSFEFKCETFMH